MEFLKEINKKLGYSNRVKIDIGDTVGITYESPGGYWRVRKFMGICIKKSRKGINERYTLRNVINDIPVELSFYRYWGSLVSVEKLSSNKIKRVRRGSLLYLRDEPLNASKVRSVQ